MDDLSLKERIALNPQLGKDIETAKDTGRISFILLYDMCVRKEDSKYHKHAAVLQWLTEKSRWKFAATCKNGKKTLTTLLYILYKITNNDGIKVALTYSYEAYFVKNTVGDLDSIKRNLYNDYEIDLDKFMTLHTYQKKGFVYKYINADNVKIRNEVKVFSYEFGDRNKLKGHDLMFFDEPITKKSDNSKMRYDDFKTFVTDIIGIWTDDKEVICTLNPWDREHFIMIKYINPAITLNEHKSALMMEQGYIMVTDEKESTSVLRANQTINEFSSEIDKLEWDKVKKENYNYWLTAYMGLDYMPSYQDDEYILSPYLNNFTELADESLINYLTHISIGLDFGRRDFNALSVVGWISNKYQKRIIVLKFDKFQKIGFKMEELVNWFVESIADLFKKLELIYIIKNNNIMINVYYDKQVEPYVYLFREAFEGFEDIIYFLRSPSELKEMRIENRYDWIQKQFSLNRMFYLKDHANLALYTQEASQLRWKKNSDGVLNKKQVRNTSMDVVDSFSYALFHNWFSFAFD